MLGPAIKKARVAIQDVSLVVPSRRAGIPGYLWVWSEGRGEGQEPGGRAEVQGDRNARAHSWLPRVGVCWEPGAR